MNSEEANHFRAEVIIAELLEYLASCVEDFDDDANVQLAQEYLRDQGWRTEWIYEGD